MVLDVLKYSCYFLVIVCCHTSEHQQLNTRVKPKIKTAQ